MALKNKKTKNSKPKSLPIKKKKSSTLIKRNRDLFITQGQFAEFRSEMSAEFTSVRLEITALRSEMNSKFSALDSKFNAIDSKFSTIDSKFSELDSKINELGSKIESLTAAVHQTRMVVEEQNARNKYVLDGFVNIFESLEQHKSENQRQINELRELVFKIKPSSDSTL